MGEGALLFGSEGAHLSGDHGGYLGEDAADSELAGGGEVQGDHAAVFALALAAHETALFEVIEDEGHVAGGFEEPGAEFALAERAEVVERFQHAELAVGEAFEGFALKDAGIE